jgi:S1-C subfamily serine protease
MKKSRLVIPFVAVALIAVMLAGCSIVTEVPKTSTTSLYDENTMVTLYEKCIPAVVLINIITADNQQGQGSGFIIDNQGHILTNNHVVENTTDVKVVLHDGQTLGAEIVGTDRENDLALLKVDPSKLSPITPLPLGDSDKVKPGQMAIALGSPFELEGSITVGIISGVGRPLAGSSQRTITNILQTDAAINPGNSGGPLLNSSGEVVGINTAIETLSSGIGFAIPVNTAKSLLPELLKGGEVPTAWLGIQTIDIDEELVSELNLSVHSGIYVVNVTADGPAEKAGLKGGGLDQQGKLMPGGDIITAIDGKNISKVEDVLTYLNSKKPGDNVSLSVQRGNNVLTIQVTLGEWPESFG